MTETLLEMTSDPSTQNRERLDALRLYLITDRVLLPEGQFLAGIDYRKMNCALWPKTS
jgi:hypothetical protein